MSDAASPAVRSHGIAPSVQEALLAGRHADAFGVLGPHRLDDRTVLRVLMPCALSVDAVFEDGAELALPPVGDGLYAADISAHCGAGRPRYRLRVRWPDGGSELLADPYAFGPLLEESHLEMLAQGSWLYAGQCLGPRDCEIDGVAGVRFAVWAPNARRVALVGDFNGWNGLRHGMRLRHAAGVWEIFVPGVAPRSRYKYQILGADDVTTLRADPMARQAEVPPATASIVPDTAPFAWTDSAWMNGRAARQGPDAPLAIYEVHVGSWLDDPAPGPLWDRLAARLPAYARALGFTHIELMPIMEHPFGGSWGYQPLGMFAPSARYGTPADFARFVDQCHAAGLGVILDWVPAHFPDDPHGLARFDGTALYEYADPREGFHPDWNTLVYNLGRTEVKAYMIASALHWLRDFHVDGLRVDAVASMLYRDYSRAPGEWVPNRYGGRENLEAVDFLRELNTVVACECPGAITVAEESTAWPGVTAPARDGGLGFDYKWNMGWMHDTLRYMRHDPVHRRYHHHDVTFGMMYAYSERYILPLSHDEVVHGKGSLLGKMPGSPADRMAQLRLYYGYMWAHPGKKLLFMGGEIAQESEWNHDVPVDWNLLDDPARRGMQRLVADLNHLYCELPELHRRDADPAGFAWMVGDDETNSVLAFVRTDGEHHVLAICNFTPVARHDYRIGVPLAGHWRQRINTDDAAYGGAGLAGPVLAHTEDAPAHGQPQSVVLNLPPLSTLLLRHEV
ncbi:1,4-alpha-glucan branching protein GlgB [Bordetella petrii]|uniref:1,4-alpha-glucan branching protein GlgB n=1 Tax=Bordetella petrii TaxID=94624 RepID=UPI00048F3CB3|nr:1,4-alpha-glucan branching protein GlgB [Bordetella petrii]